MDIGDRGSGSAGTDVITSESEPHRRPGDDTSVVRRQPEPQPWTIDELAGLIRRPPAAGTIRVVAIDGRSGAGKTALAGRLAERTGAAVIHMDDLYPGWDGLAAAAELLVSWVLEPLAAGRQPHWRHYDWDTGRYDGTRSIEVADLLIVEGCGAGAREAAPYLSTLIWVEASEQLRHHRLAGRADWQLYRPHLANWAAQEDTFYARHDPRARADLGYDADATDTANTGAASDTPAAGDTGDANDSGQEGAGGQVGQQDG